MNAEFDTATRCDTRNVVILRPDRLTVLSSLLNAKVDQTDLHITQIIKILVVCVLIAVTSFALYQICM